MSGLGSNPKAGPKSGGTAYQLYRKRMRDVTHPMLVCKAFPNRVFVSHGYRNYYPKIWGQRLDGATIDPMVHPKKGVLTVAYLDRNGCVEECCGKSDTSRSETCPSSHAIGASKPKPTHPQCHPHNLEIGNTKSAKLSRALDIDPGSRTLSSRKNDLCATPKEPHH